MRGRGGEGEKEGVGSEEREKKRGSLKNGKKAFPLRK
jgi:hypothetical protein